MSVEVEEFEWDEHNVTHLEHAHPHIGLDLLENIVSEARRYRVVGFDKYGKKIYSAQHGKLRVLFNLKPGRVARIFSVHEVK